MKLNKVINFIMISTINEYLFLRYIKELNIPQSDYYM